MMYFTYIVKIFQTIKIFAELAEKYKGLKSRGIHNGVGP